MGQARGCGLLVCLLSAAVLSAQSNEFLDEILASGQIRYSEVCYLVLTSQGTLDESVSLLEAFDVCRAAGLAEPTAEPDDPVTLGRFSHQLMQGFGISGGIGYSVFPGPRYAVRELAFRRIVQGHAYPGMQLSGERALRILGRMLAHQEDRS